MITLAALERWLAMPAESERLEFREAKQTFDQVKLLRYCAALANEGGGYLVLGVTNRPPRQVVATRAFPSETALNEIKTRITCPSGLDRVLDRKPFGARFQTVRRGVAIT